MTSNINPIAGLFERLSAAASQTGLAIAALCVVVSTGMIFYEILLRALFNTSTFILQEFVGYAVATMIFMGLGGTFRAGAHVRVTLLLDNISGRLRTVIELVCLIITALLTLLATTYFSVSIIKHVNRGTVSNSIAEIPLWIPQSLMLLGLIIFLLELVSYFIRLLTGSDTIPSNQIGD